MSKHRVVKSDFWIDDYFEELPIKERYFFLYLLTNPETNILGIYKTTLKRMSFETGLTKAELNSCLDKFSELDKVHFIESYILMVNFHKHNLPSGTMKRGIEKLILNLPLGITDFILSKESSIYNRLSIGYLDSIHRANKDKGKDTNKGKDESNGDPDTSQAELRAEKKRRRMLYLEKFNILWDTFPERDGRVVGKTEAMEEFNKIDEKDLDNLLKAVLNYKESGVSPKDPSRFIKKNFWKDYLVDANPQEVKQNRFEKPKQKTSAELVAEMQDNKEPKDVTPIRIEA